MKYLLLMTESSNVINFRKGLIQFLQDKGHRIVVVAHDAERENEIRDLGAAFYCAKQKNRGLNPFSVLKYRKRLRTIIAAEKPEIVFTFQLKPNVFGVQAAHKAGVRKIFSMVEGLGDVYINNGLKWKLIRVIVNCLYKKAFKKVEKVFFLNNDDMAEFTGRRLVSEDKCERIYGIGVDLRRFAYVPMKNHARFLMVARMLRTKGVFEYCKCARAVKSRYPDAQFDYLGEEGSVRLADIKEYVDGGIINYLGTVNDVRPYLEKTSVLILPSYREGMPVSVMEAEAVGRAVIVTDCAGCRDVVTDGYNGFLVKAGDSVEMAEKAVWYIEHPDETAKMGLNARTFAEERFNSEKINENIYRVIGI